MFLLPSYICVQKYDKSLRFSTGLRKKSGLGGALRWVVLLLLFLMAVTVQAARTIQLASAVTVAETTSYGSVVISEIMSDPEPVVELPNVEYVELHNRSLSAIYLAGWVFWYDNRPFRLPAYTLSAGGYVILCSASGAVKLDSTQHALSVPSFPYWPARTKR